MFSSRTSWNLQTNRLADLLEAKRRSGAALIDLTESNPTRAGLPYPPDLLQPLAAAAALRYEPAPFGLWPAREAACADFVRRGGEVTPERIFLTASTSEAYAFLFKLVAEAGDEILVPQPGYPLFEFLAGLESVQARGYALSWEDGWRLDLGAIRAALSSRTRAVVVVNPNNPTGVFLKHDELRGLQHLCAERGLALISDEVFSDYGIGHPPPGRVLTVAEDGPALSFALGGLSKSCGLPQLKLAWTAVNGPGRLVAEALARLEVIADSYLSVGTPVQVALPALLASRDALQAPIRERVAGNLATLRRRIADTTASLLTPEGGWYAVLRVPATSSEEERVLRLAGQHDVLVHPGYFFDFPHEAFLVASLLPTPAEFEQGLSRVMVELET